MLLKKAQKEFEEVPQLFIKFVLFIFLSCNIYALNNTKLDLKTLSILVSEELNVSILMSSDISNLSVDFVLQDYSKSDLYSMFEKFIISKKLKIHKFNNNSMFISSVSPQNKKLFIFTFRYITPSFFLNSISPYLKSSSTPTSKSSKNKAKSTSKSHTCSVSLNSLVCFVTKDDYLNILALKDVIDKEQVFLKYKIYLLTYSSFNIKSFDYSLINDNVKINSNSFRFFLSCFVSSCSTSKNFDFNFEFKNKDMLYKTIYQNTFYSLVNETLNFSLTDTKRLINSSYDSKTDGVKNDYEDKKVGFTLKIKSTIVNKNLYNIKLNVKNSFFNDDVISSQDLSSNFLLENNKTIILSDFKKVQTLHKKDKSLFFDFLSPFSKNDSFDKTSLIIQVVRI